MTFEAITLQLRPDTLVGSSIVYQPMGVCRKKFHDQAAQEYIHFTPVLQLVRSSRTEHMKLPYSRQEKCRSFQI